MGKHGSHDKVATGTPYNLWAREKIKSAEGLCCLAPASDRAQTWGFARLGVREEVYEKKFVKSRKKKFRFWLRLCLAYGKKKRSKIRIGPRVLDDGAIDAPIQATKKIPYRGTPHLP